MLELLSVLLDELPLEVSDDEIVEELFVFVLLVWIGSAMLYSFVRLYYFLDLFGLFGWFELFQWFVLTLGFAWTVLIVCIVLIVGMAFEDLGQS